MRQEIQRNFAKELLAEGETIERIVRITKLMVAEVKELAKNNENCY